jgi:hypothetical protein
MIFLNAVKRLNRIMDWIMEVVNLRCDGHHLGSNPDRRVKPTVGKDRTGILASIILAVVT